MKIKLQYLCILLALLAGIHQAVAQGTTAFTYQGQLHDGGTNANGTYTMIFKLYDSSTSGNQIGSTITTSPTLANGLFSVNLDFGAGSFNGSARYLDITVQSGSDSEELSPRVQVLPAPYALYSAVAATVTNGAIMNAQLAGNAVNTTNIQTNAITSEQLASDSASLSQVSGGTVYVQSNSMVSFTGGGVTLSENFGVEVPPSTWNIVNGYSYTENEDGFDPGYFVDLLSFVGSSGDVPLQILDEQQTGWSGISTPNLYADTVYASNVVAAGTFYGDGSGLTNLSVSPVPCMQVFDTPGTYQFTVPQNVTKIMVEVWGGGGGGGNAFEYPYETFLSGEQGSPSTGYVPGSGGGAGGYGKGVFVVTPGETITMTVGLGGSPGANGGTSSVVDGSENTLISSTGGFGATTNSFFGVASGNYWSVTEWSVPGAGGTNGSPINITGGSGSLANYNNAGNVDSGGDGGSAGRGGSGGKGDGFTYYSRSDSEYVNGSSGAGAGQFPGGGGGGGAYNSLPYPVVLDPGASGGNGEVVIYY
ncbi:MAG TPA: hypothetical protein VMD27_03205 [Candidatus Aquilonibacter sp.]|nr:hypothetical protein [Candidatus Aquilonibacter sp.]